MRPELLAPAGSPEALRAAVQNGADAVYLGWGAFNARRGAKNFSDEEFAAALAYCHERGVRVFLTLNTLVTDRELPQALETAVQAGRLGVDAVLVQDWGLFGLLRRTLPDLPLHASTQMSLFTSGGAREIAADGCERVVIARECSAEDTRTICENCPVEVEVFAHGALCMCYSGQCEMSALIGGRSGNRGRCAQPCRQSYGYGRWENKYPLSLKDNCLVGDLASLEVMGVASVKLEGRMKRPEYVAAVTGVYRKALDTGRVSREQMNDLHRAFNRQGFTDGYYAGRIGPEMFGIREDTKEDTGWMKDVRQTYEAVENPLVPVRFRGSVTRSGLWLSVTDPEGRTCRLTGKVPEEARLVAVDADQIAMRLSKTGGTPYAFAGAQIEVEPGLSVSAAEINSLRRDLLNQLTALRGRSETPRLGHMDNPRIYPGSRGTPALTVQVTEREQITERLLKNRPEVLYVPIHLLVKDPDWCAALTSRVREVCAVLPRIVHDGELPNLKNAMVLLKNAGVRSVLAGNLGLLAPARECGMVIRGDFGLNIFNSRSMNLLRDMELASAMLSFEMTLPQMRDISKAVNAEVFAYGRLPLMVTENCIIKNRTGQCTCNQGPVRLTDKTGADFPVIKDGASCRSVLLNGKKLYWLDRQEDLDRLGVWAERMYFTTENPREVDQVLANRVRSAPFDPGACTRGLYLRGLD